MREQHLDLLAEPARGASFTRPCNLAGHVASALIDRARHPPRRLRGATPGLQCAAITIALTGEVKYGGPIIHQRSGRSKNFATGATIDVPGMVVGEVVAREDPV